MVSFPWCHFVGAKWMTCPSNLGCLEDQHALLAQLGRTEVIVDLARSQFGCYVAKSLLQDSRVERVKVESINCLGRGWSEYVCIFLFLRLWDTLKMEAFFLHGWFPFGGSLKSKPHPTGFMSGTCTNCRSWHTCMECLGLVHLNIMLIRFCSATRRILGLLLTIEELIPTIVPLSTMGSCHWMIELVKDRTAERGVWGRSPKAPVTGKGRYVQFPKDILRFPCWCKGTWS